MIFSKLGIEGSRSPYPKAIRTVLDYLAATDVMALELGRHDLDGDNIFLNVMDMTTRPFEGSHPEVHQRYIDLMYWPEGGERIGVAPYLGSEPIFEDPPEQDITFLAEVENESILLATAGCFGVFFPWDAHRPGLMLGDAPATSRKLVAKIAVELLEEG